jgi:hypothetical protein
VSTWGGGRVEGRALRRRMVILAVFLLGLGIGLGASGGSGEAGREWAHSCGSEDGVGWVPLLCGNHEGWTDWTVGP